jgi:hypothetical protein
MDNDRPSLDLKYFEAIRPHNNGILMSTCDPWIGIDIMMWNFQVPVIAVFTKYDQFKRNIKMKLEDEGRDPETNLDAEVENIFKQHYLASLNGPPPFIRLESEDHVSVN